MTSPSDEARQRMVKDTFGRDLSLDEVRALGARIDAAVRNVGILASYQASFDQREPAAVFVMPVHVPVAEDEP